MNIQLEKDVFYPVLSQVQGILEKRSATLPVFRNILISAKQGETVQICASDSEISFSADLPCKIEKKGAVAVNGKKIFEIIREFSSQALNLTVEEKHNIKISQNQAKFSIPGLSAEDFPAFPSLKKKKTHKIPALDILDVIEKTIYCVSLDESRYHLTGVFLALSSPSYWRFAATDAHRLSFIDIKGKKTEDLERGIIIPRKGLQEIRKMLSGAQEGDALEISIEKPRLLARFKNQSLNIRLVEGEYPDYAKILPEDRGNKAVILKEVFLSSLKRISSLTSDRFKGVDFSLKKDKLHIYFSHPDAGEASEELACEYKGEDVTARFNSRYIQDILQAIHEERLSFFIKDKSSAGIIQPEGKERYVCLVMPMKKSADTEEEDEGKDPEKEEGPSEEGGSASNSPDETKTDG